ncbi:hypothetical protein BDY21DRAFT_3243 [Lineolata rhizophorae]|uniref:T6SS Phospholipase effector Tle1-like catalytic domain-containing protein n=1 Tax=Lineolata rhizophorae TaxID=578093 RepID=A0A6A6PDH6_9PEZI|nr:hypothetical protein BDY21DRAFT_3243 [Lineolata rhizophorae]
MPLVGPSKYQNNKRLIICCDGTWFNSDNGWVEGTLLDPTGHLQTPSNVTRISRAIPAKTFDGHDQIVFYQSGVGTSWSTVERYVGGATGEGLSENIREAYGFICNNWAEGDEIFLIGFSRGAWTARSIGGLIGSMGLLNKEGLPFFYDVLKDWENAGSLKYKPKLPSALADFKLEAVPGNAQDYLSDYKAKLKHMGMIREPRVMAIGVWDTVGALGIPVSPVMSKLCLPTTVNEYRFNDTGLGNHIQNAFHALSLDETRSPFSPTLWERPPGCHTNLKQVWFPGSHADVGGGYDQTAPADISLAWMMSQLHYCGLEFNRLYVNRLPSLPFSMLRPAPLYATGNPEPKPKQSGLFSTKRATDGNSPFRGWAQGTLHTTQGFPSNLLFSKPRTPGLYRRVDGGTGKRTGHALSDTCEFVHASVRARILLRGPKANDKSGVYRPKALAGWALQDEGPVLQHADTVLGGASSQHEAADKWSAEDGGDWSQRAKDVAQRHSWVYRGRDKAGYEEGHAKVLREDELGHYELELAKMDPLAARAVLGC